MKYQGILNRNKKQNKSKNKKRKTSRGLLRRSFFPLWRWSNPIKHLCL